MCQAASQTIIDEVVKEFVAQRKPFTALNVSIAVRKKGGTERHRHMKDYIHQATSSLISADQTWERTLINPPGTPPGTPQAFLYFPTEFDPKDFGKDPDDDPNQPIAGQFTAATNGASPAPSAFATSKSGTPTASQKVPDGAVAAAPKDHRVCVPKKLLTDLGLHPGDTVHVLVDQGSGKIELKSKPDPAATNNLTVDVRGTVRLSPRTLHAAGLSGSVFDVDRSGDNITVKVH